MMINKRYTVKKKTARRAAVLISAALFLVVSLMSCRSEKPAARLEGETGRIDEKAGQREILYYTCGMHPSVRVSPEDYKAGSDSCPICKMDLIPVYREGPGPSGDEMSGPSAVVLSERARSLAQVQTVEVRFRHLFRDIRTVGRIAMDERRISAITSRVSGRIDRLYADFTGVNVSKGAPLVWIYSPALLTTQQEYLLAKETRDRLSDSGNEAAVRGAENLVEAAEQRLKLWGISPGQIADLEQAGKTSTHMTIFSPAGGTVIEKAVDEGEYVREGQPLYEIADLKHLWMLADVYEEDMAGLKKGQEVHITSIAWPGEMFHGRVAFIDPVVSMKTRSVQVRVDVPNPGGKLKPGMYVDAALRSPVNEGIAAGEAKLYTCPMHPEVISEDPDEPCPICKMRLVEMEQPAPGTVLAVPADAVLDTGERALVYIEQEKGIYKPVVIRTGALAQTQVDGLTEKYFAVLSGLAPGMKVVSRANFLIDSQGQITGQAEAVYSGSLERGDQKPPTKHIH